MAIQRDHAADYAFAANVAILDDIENLAHNGHGHVKRNIGVFISPAPVSNQTI